jgi:hypothetical protein
MKSSSAAAPAFPFSPPLFQSNAQPAVFHLRLQAVETADIGIPSESARR